MTLEFRIRTGSRRYVGYTWIPSYKLDTLGSTVSQADYVWKIILMFRAMPVAMTFYSRMKVPETAKYTALVAKNAKQVAADMSKVLQMEIEVELGKVEKSCNSFDKDKTKTDAGYPADVGVKKSLMVLGEINFLGMLFMLLVSESKGKFLEELSGENVEETEMTKLEEPPVGYTNRNVPA
ncbi:hypothetical protein GIB67_036850 [Kingdonia uniflora]|uniref:Uncharacterized protein n=1 Tax=Kingdonia uniflora TaxID=39325 RepID=A0A7J7LWU4_9MAGN|nr:hypothetical protein GIB67_036850 [Kingdonia uniflora]